MADPVLGSNAIMRIFKNGAYRDFVCATDISIEFTTELKPTKTVGDGVWKQYKPQSLGYIVSLNGVMKLNETDAAAFDLLAEQIAFHEVLFRITFEDSSSNVKAIFGSGVIESSSFNGPTEGFTTESFKITGTGEPDIFDTKTPCTATLSANISTRADDPAHNYQINITASSSGCDSIGYSINGAPVVITDWTGGTTGVIPIQLASGSNTIYVIPICTNGLFATAVTLTQTV